MGLFSVITDAPQTTQVCLRLPASRLGVTELRIWKRRESENVKRVNTSNRMPSLASQPSCATLATLLRFYGTIRVYGSWSTVGKYLSSGWEERLRFSIYWRGALLAFHIRSWSLEVTTTNNNKSKRSTWERSIYMTKWEEVLFYAS